MFWSWMTFALTAAASTSHALSPGFYIVFDPVTHTTQFLEVSGEETTERRSLSVVFNDVHAHRGTLALRPGPVWHSWQSILGPLR